MSIFLFNCGQINDKNNPKIVNQNNTGTGKLISIDFSDTNYTYLELYAKDTVTAAGWKIKYLVKDDSTRYNDIYIQWTKENMTGLFYGGDILLMRRYFIPTYSGETNSHIYLEHGCATDCFAILTLSKDNMGEFRDYENIVDFNIKLGQILYVTDYSYENEDRNFELALADLSKQKTHKLTYSNICSAVFKPTCIDTVIFTKTKVTIKTTLRENIATEKDIKQSREIEL